MNDLISRQEAIDAFWKLDVELRPSAINAILDMFKNVPPAQPTLYGYDIESLKTIAIILAKENMPPEKVMEVLTDTGRIVALIIQDEFEKTLRNMREVNEIN